MPKLVQAPRSWRRFPVKRNVPQPEQINSSTLVALVESWLLPIHPSLR
uniref:Transposase n=1 Tax=Ascaris lumbricoides TaxID=6252 RepID=A0A0M3ISJ2_ASCLU